MELRHFLRLLWRRRRQLFWGFAPVFLLLAGLGLLAEPQYVASAKVLLGHSPNTSSLLGVVSLDAVMQNAASLTDTERSTYEEFAGTALVLRPVVDELRLTRKRKSLQLVELVPFVRRAVDRFFPRFGRRPLPYEELANKSFVHVLFPRPYVQAAMVEDADILEFSASADSMGLAVALANAAARSFLDRETAMRQEECRALARAAENALPRAHAVYAESLEAESAIRREEKVVDLSHEASRIVDRYTTLAADRDASRLALLKTRAMEHSVAAQLPGRPRLKKSATVRERSSAVDGIKTTLRDLYLDLAVARTRMTAAHPAVREIEAKIEAAKRLLKNEALKVFGAETVSTDPTYNFLQERLAAYAADSAGYETQDAAYATLLADLDKVVAAYPGRAAAVALASARTQAAQTFLLNLRRLRAAAALGRHLPLSLGRVAQAAVMPGDSDAYARPRLSLFLAMGVAVGVFLALAAALVAEYVDAAVKRPWLPVPRGNGRLPAVSGGDAGARAQDYRRLRETLFPANVAAPRRVVVSASVAGDADACRALALGLAVALARGGRRTLLADTRLGDDALARMAGVAPQPGLADVLAGKTPPDAAIAAPHAATGLFVLPAGTPPPSPEAVERLFDGPGLDATLSRLGAAFDTVVLCAAPVDGSGDAAILARPADVVVLAATRDRTPRAALDEALARLRGATGGTARTVFYGAPEDGMRARRIWAALRARLPRSLGRRCRGT